MRHNFKHVHAGRAARSAADDAPVDVAVDVAAQRTTAARAPAAAAGLEQRGERRRAGALGEIVSVVKYARTAACTSSSVTSDDPSRAAPDDLQRRRDRHAHGHAVGKVSAVAVSTGVRGANDARSVGPVGDDADDLSSSGPSASRPR